MFDRKTFVVIVVVLLIFAFIQMSDQNSRFKTDLNNMEQFTTGLNSRGPTNYGQILKPFSPYIKPYTHAIFDKNWNYITLLDTLPTLGPNQKFVQVPCPESYYDGTVCWQYICK